jgi:hypothetical protein
LAQMMPAMSREGKFCSLAVMRAVFPLELQQDAEFMEDVLGGCAFRGSCLMGQAPRKAADVSLGVRVTPTC